MAPLAPARGGLRLLFAGQVRGLQQRMIALADRLESEIRAVTAA